MTGEPAAGQCPGHHRVFETVRKFRHQGAEKGKGSVVVEGGQNRGPQHEWNFAQPAQHRLDPPSLDPSVHHQSAQEKTHQQRRFEIDAILKRSGGPGKAQEKKQAGINNWG